MKMQEAMEIINASDGYMVSFEEVVGGFLVGGHFPDKHNGELLIRTEEEAWDFAIRFAEKTVGKYVNIYVIGSDFVPVAGYRKRMIKNRRVNHGDKEPV